VVAPLGMRAKAGGVANQVAMAAWKGHSCFCGPSAGTHTAACYVQCERPVQPSWKPARSI